MKRAGCPILAALFAARVGILTFCPCKTSKPVLAFVIPTRERSETGGTCCCRVCVTFHALLVSASIPNMAIAKQSQSRRTDTSPSARSRKTQSSKKTLRQLYARLEKTQPGTEESKRISEQIVNAIG
jgi:hypothetical protein